MKQTLEVSKQCELLKQEINDIVENTFPARILQVVGSLIRRITRRSVSPPWFVITILLAVLAVLPQALLAFFLKQPNQFWGNGLIWSISVLIIIPSIPLSYLVTKYIFIILRDHILDRMEDKEDLDDLRSFLLQIKDQRKALFHVLTASFTWSIVAISIFSFLNGNFIGVGLSIDIWIWGFCAPGIGLYTILWYMQFPNRLKKYQYDLYELNPSRSEVLVYISAIFTRPFITFALYLAFGTILCSVFKVFFWVVFVVVVLFWIPLLIQFINSRTAINEIVSKKKWQTLNNLQEQIHAYKNDNSVNVSQNIEAINKLMDLHEKVYNSRNTNLTINSVFDLLNQLFIPLFAFIISNYESILKFFKLIP